MYHGAIDYGDVGGSPGDTLTAMIRCRNIGEVLTRKFPGYTWMVQPYQDGTAYQITCMELSGKWGFVIHENKIDNDYRVIVRAGGEIL